MLVWHGPALSVVEGAPARVRAASQITGHRERRPDLSAILIQPIPATPATPELLA